MATTTRANITSTTRWWWKKSSSSRSKKTPPSIKSSVPSSVNGADEDASMFSLYSCGESLFASSSVHNMPSSICAQRTKSEYSGMSDIESNASILSKPWISRNIIIPDSDQHLKQDEENADSFIPAVNNTWSSEILDSSKLSMEQENLYPTQSSSSRRGSLVDYIVNKPLHGKLKAGLGRLVGNNKSHGHSDSIQPQEVSPSASSSEAAARRRSCG